MQQITLHDVVRMAEKIKHANPDYVYEKGHDGLCVYSRYDNNGITRCLVGQVVYDLGVDIDEHVSGEDEEINAEGVENLMGFLEDADLVSFPEDEKPLIDKFLSVAQSYQDRGFAWGEAVDLAMEELEYGLPQWVRDRL